MSMGRLTPSMYAELAAAVNVSYALQHYTPPLLSLQNCNFVRGTFGNISSSYCPPLEQHLRTVNAGLALISVGVMLNLALWILMSENRPRLREEVFDKILSRVRRSRKKRDKNVVSTGSTPITGASTGFDFR